MSIMPHLMPPTGDTVDLRVAIFVLSEMGRDVSRQIELHVHRTTALRITAASVERRGWQSLRLV